MSPAGEPKSGMEAFSSREVGSQNQPFETEMIPYTSQGKYPSAPNARAYSQRFDSSRNAPMAMIRNRPSMRTPVTSGARSSRRMESARADSGASPLIHRAA